MNTTLRMARFALLLIAAVAGTGSATAAPPETLAGRWDAVLVGKGPDIPFRLDISGAGPTLKATFFDGRRPYETTTSATFNDGQLVLDVAHYLTRITATLENGKLVGDTSLRGPGYSARFGFRAERHVDKPGTEVVTVPSIAGSWEIPLAEPSSKGEKAWRFVVEQNGAEASAAILRVDGDTGALNGTYRDGKWILSHFDGNRPDVIEVVPGADGTLKITQGNALLHSILSGGDESKHDDGYAAGGAALTGVKLVAYRPDVARAKGFAQPADYRAHTRARDPNEKFTFSFPDLTGKVRSQDDPYFKDQVILAVVTGTWCPNCHDEAQYLVELDRKYRDKGLRIVALNFEELEQQESQQRARAFVDHYGVKYPYLLAGAPSDMWEKVPQLVNLNSWPTTVFVGRDGTIRGVHSGFASPASGQFHGELNDQFTQQIEQLLAEKPSTPVRLSAVIR